MFQGDGLLIIDPGTGDDILTVAAISADREVPVIRCEQRDARRVLVCADGPCR